MSRLFFALAFTLAIPLADIRAAFPPSGNQATSETASDLDEDAGSWRTTIDPPSRTVR